MSPHIKELLWSLRVMSKAPMKSVRLATKHASTEGMGSFEWFSGFEDTVDDINPACITSNKEHTMIPIVSGP